MYVRFWGTRGSIATPGRTTAVYGGNTSCTEVRAADGTVIVLDCGTGARGLGLHLVRTMPQPMRIHLFIGHTHWDHIQGFPFFVPAFRPGAELNIYAPLGFQRGLEEAMAGQMEYSYFPVKLRELQSRIHYTELDEGFLRVGDVLVETQYLNHTAPTIAYRLSSGGATLAYMTDHEPFWSVPGRVSQHPGDERHIAFMRGADLVIHDAQYTEEEYRSKVGWGHSPLEYAVDVALAAGARRLALFHHDPQHDDTIMERIESEARARAVSRGAALEVLAAREGLELELSGNGSARDVGAASALQHRQIAGGRVLVVSGDDKEIAAIEEVLGEDALVLLRLADMSAGGRSSGRTSRSSTAGCSPVRARSPRCAHASAGETFPSSCSRTAPRRLTSSPRPRRPPPTTSPGPSARRCCGRGFAPGSRARGWPPTQRVACGRGRPRTPTASTSGPAARACSRRCRSSGHSRTRSASC